MTEVILTQIVENIKKCTYFSLQIDESTDIRNCAKFIAFVRYDTKYSITENILFCTLLEANTNRKCLFNIFIKSTNK